MSWVGELTKGQRRELQRIAELAYDRELSSALSGLEEQFRRWRSGEIGPHDLAEAIHQFHQGPSRELWLRYSDKQAGLAALHAVANGVVNATEVAPDLLAALKPRLSLPE